MHKNRFKRILTYPIVVIISLITVVGIASAASTATEQEITNTLKEWGTGCVGRAYVAVADGKFLHDSPFVSETTSNIAVASGKRIREDVGTALLGVKNGVTSLDISFGFEVYPATSSMTVTGSSNSTGKYWGSGAFDFSETTSFFIVRVLGEKDYYIVVPPAGHEVPMIRNGKVVKEDGHTVFEFEAYEEDSSVEYERVYALSHRLAIEALDTIKTEVKKGVLAAYIDAGFNIFSAYSLAQTPVSSIMEEVDGGLFKFKENLSKSQLSYTLDAFIHPGFGRLAGAAVPKTEKEWETVASGTYTKSYKVPGSTTNETMSLNFGDLMTNDGKLVVSPGYVEFITGEGAGRETLEKMDNVRTIQEGVQPFAGKGSVEGPQNYVDYGMQIMLPDVFVKAKTTGYFGLRVDDKTNFQLHSFTVSGAESVRLSLRNDTMYLYKANGSVEKFLTCADIQLEREHIILYNYNSGGKAGDTTNPPVYTGIVIPLQYYEGVANTKKDSNANPPEDDVYFTGRRVVLDNSYSGKLPFFDTNRDMMYIDTKTGGREGVGGSLFAFEGGDTDWDTDFYMNSENHRSYNDTPNMFRFVIDFKQASSTDPEDNAQGFVIIRNNAYVKDDSLLQWLDTDEAKGIPFVKAAQLKSKILGEFTAGSRELTFADWQNMQRIKQELDNANQNFLVSVIRVICIVFGVFLVVFAILLVMAYWMDIFNTFLDFSIVQFISMGRMYPISSEESTKYIVPTSNNVKYVTFVDIIKISSLSILVGVGFMYFTPILTFFYNIFSFLMYRFGG